MAHSDDDSLEVLLHGESVGVLTKGKKHGSATFRYHPNAPYALSVSMPVRELPYDPIATANWFTGLLPEGEHLNFLAKHFVVSLTDYVDILRETGRDCSGAVTFGSPAPEATHATTSVAADLDLIVPALPKIHAGADDDSLRSIVAGFQPKTPAAKNAHWVGSDPHFLTTHIAKPEPKKWKGMVDAEAWAMTLVSRATKTASVQVKEFGGRRTLLVERFDRFYYDGDVYGVHQEDFCQALGLPTGRKHAEAGSGLKTSPSLKKLAAMFKERAVDPERELDELLRHVVANVVVGNLDWHAKNVGLMHDVDGAISLAPLYDVVPTKHFIPTDFKMSMSVNKKFLLERIGLNDLVAEAESWGMKREPAMESINTALQNIATNFSIAEAEYPTRPEGVPDLVLRQLEKLGPNLKEKL
jgi:serine/threonine-protein kinase HipA